MSALSLIAPSRLSRLLAADAVNVARDPMLVFAAAMSIAPALLLFAGRGALDATVLGAFGIATVSTYLVPFALVLPAFLIGWVMGFLLLEDRDEGMLLAIDVTPTGKSGFLTYRVTMAFLVTVAITLIGGALLIPGAGALMLALIAILIAMEAVASAVVLPAIARNKVEGLALTKLTNIAAITPLLALIPSPFRYVAGIIPSYWIGELLGLGRGEFALPLWALVAIALVAHIAAIIVLLRLFQRRVG